MDQLQYQLDLLSAMNDKLSDNEKMYRLICDASSDAYIYYNFKSETWKVVGNWKHFFDFELQERKDIFKVPDYVKEESATDLQDIIFLEKQKKTFAKLECQHRMQKLWMEFETSVQYDADNQPMEKVIRIKDVTKSKSQHDELEYMAYYDSLTNLYNRNYFIRTLSEWLEKAEMEHAIVSVMFIDIDDFRKINDGMGLIVGDELVQLFGQFLGEFSSETVKVSHFNSDIFCIAIYEPYGMKSAKAIADAIHERLSSKPFQLTGNKELSITTCIGVAEYPEAADNAVDLINCAEIVMFKAKTLGKNSTQYFDSPILDDFLNNINMEHKLREATLTRNFSMCFQPQYDSQDGKLRGVEALIRWKDDEGNAISPALFIPIAEKNGMIIPIGEWVLEKSISTFAEWKKKFDYPLILSINISAVQYKRPDFVPKLLSILQKYQIEPQTIELEITESVLIEDFEDVIKKMYQLKEIGIRVSLDDFGTGYSSLSYLKGLPIDTLKIDKSFIDTVTSDDTTKIITESIISMVKKLGFETVAEGVETKEQFEYLKKIDCDNIQGFLLGKPMSAEDIEVLLMKSV